MQATTGVHLEGNSNFNRTDLRKEAESVGFGFPLYSCSVSVPCSFGSFSGKNSDRPNKDKSLHLERCTHVHERASKPEGALAFTMFRCALLILPVALGAQQSAPSDVMSAMRSGTAQSAMASAAELPHPFFTHMGMPEGVGVYSLRVGGLANQGVDPAMGMRRSDFFFHFETGLTERIGVHVRNDQSVRHPGRK